MTEREGYHWRRRDWPSAAQRRVLDALLNGGTNAQISALLGLSFETVKWHVSALLAETGLGDRTSLAHWLSQQLEESRRIAMTQERRGTGFDDLMTFA